MNYKKKYIKYYTKKPKIKKKSIDNHNQIHFSCLLWIEVFFVSIQQNKLIIARHTHKRTRTHTNLQGCWHTVTVNKQATGLSDIKSSITHGLNPFPFHRQSSFGSVSQYSVVFLFGKFKQNDTFNFSSVYVYVISYIPKTTPFFKKNEEHVYKVKSITFICWLDF